MKFDAKSPNKLPSKCRLHGILTITTMRESDGLADFSDYIVFVDESGDHGLSKIDPEFPVFALSFCVIAKSNYIENVVPAFQQFKFNYWGHDAVVLHEHEMRKSKGPFSLLMTSRELRQGFFNRLNQMITDTEMNVFASVIDKTLLVKKYSNPFNPYELAMMFCMERLLRFLWPKAQFGKTVHVLFESRGKKEDSELELEFRRIADSTHSWNGTTYDFKKMNFQPLFVHKQVNSTGLQLADLTARPIALHKMRPEQENRAFDIISPKVSGYKTFP